MAASDSLITTSPSFKIGTWPRGLRAMASGVLLPSTTHGMTANHLLTRGEARVNNNVYRTISGVETLQICTLLSPMHQDDWNMQAHKKDPASCNERRFHGWFQASANMQLLTLRKFDQARVIF